MRRCAAIHLPQLPLRDLHPDQLKDVYQDISRSLFAFSARVEQADGFEAAWFLDPTGLHHLYGDYSNWAHSVHAYLRARKLESGVMVGFQRYACLALACNRRGVCVLASPEKERALAESLALHSLQFPADLLERLSLLGLKTLGDFLRLPAGELAARFGSRAQDLHALFAESHDVALAPYTPEEPIALKYQIDPPDDDRHRLFFTIKGGLHLLLQQIQARHEKLKALELDFALEDKSHVSLTISPAQSTGDILMISDLVRLKLEEQTLSDRVEEINLQAQTERVQAEQLPMLERPQRDLRLARHALAKVRALFGVHSVTIAKLRDAHLPEAQFSWESSLDLRLPLPRASATFLQAPAISVRQLLRRPLPLSKQKEAPQQISHYGRVQHLYGPYRLSGGWWKRTVERDYYYADTDSGTWVSMFYDFPRHAWFMHGVVD